MTLDGILVLRALFGPIWALFTSWCFPGTNVTPAAMGFFILLVGLVLRYVKRKMVNTDGGE